ncbi:hypothetical protein CSKR_113433 [Clonorchis sinensis]|uniref:Uncharacterized protein n=1 Tax=Clonorchis sinensis TaxID=79923 RepID=A0A3R7GC67_CLOSI|nr:hypothetical protein CSKR_113433 [Clonorchis sinensis]
MFSNLAAWCSTFSCLETSQTRDSAGFQVSLSQKTKLICNLVYFSKNSPIWVQVEHKVDGNSGNAPTRLARIGRVKPVVGCRRVFSNLLSSFLYRYYYLPYYCARNSGHVITKTNHTPSSSIHHQLSSPCHCANGHTD